MGFISYAQNNEDVLLHRVFGGQETGFYVDVGAYHPVEGSVTKALYDRGWSGINVEPGSVFDELAAARPRDVNLRMAVMDRQGDISFMEDALDRGMSHVVDGESAGAVKSVPCDTLENIVRSHGRGRPVDIVKIDAEGAEAAIIRSTDWRWLRPRVLLIEATLPWSSVLSNQDWEPALLEQGYVRAYFDGINCFYVPQEEAQNLMRHFATPVGVLDGVRRHEFVQAAAERARLEGELSVARAQIAALETQASELEEKDRHITAARSKIDELSSSIADLRSRISDQNALKHEIEQSHAARQEVLAERDRIAAERDQMAQDLEATRQRQAVASAASLAAQASNPQPSTLRRFSRRASRLVYYVVRPVVRPVAWRLRSFMTMDVAARLDAINDRLAGSSSLRASVTSLPADMDEIRRSLNSEVASVAAAPLAEMRRLACAMEAGILTLAMESAGTPRLAEPSDRREPASSGDSEVSPGR